MENDNHLIQNIKESLFSIKIILKIIFDTFMSLKEQEKYVYENQKIIITINSDTIKEISDIDKKVSDLLFKNLVFYFNLNKHN